MAPSLNTKTLSLCSLFSLLLFLHVHGSSARELKVEEELPEQNEPSYIHYPYSQKDQTETGKPYITAYGNDKKVNEPYFDGYRHSQNGKKEKSEPYITAYGTSKGENQPYITAYGGNDKKGNKPYFGGYRHSQNGKKEKSEPYITAYGTSKRVNQPYITGYANDKKLNQPYITGYTNGKKVNQPYITGYSNGKKVNQPYITGYTNGKKVSQGENPKESFAAINKIDHTEAFKTGFFALDDLHLGNKMTLEFPIEEFPHFLTRKEDDSIPFSTSQLPSVLQLLSVPQDSPMDQAMRGTLEQCELQPLTAERKVCVSSLESMIDFVRSVIGSDSRLDILTTTLPATSRSVPLQSLTVLEISPDFYAPKWVACHPLPYPYAVFYCHFIGSGTKIFKVKLGSENGEQMEAVGVCHLDTSEWDPDHIIFKQLGFKAGEAPVCHFFPVKHLMWIPLPSEATM